MLYFVGACWLMVSEFYRSGGHLSENYRQLSAAVSWLGVLCILSVSVLQWQRSKARRRLPLAGLMALSLVDLCLIGAAALTWLRGANSRLLLAGGSDLLACLTVVLVLQTSWYAVDWWQRREFELAESDSRQQRLVQSIAITLHIVVGIAMIFVWLWLEMLALPSGS
jgi:hypothetical protein